MSDNLKVCDNAVEGKASKSNVGEHHGGSDYHRNSTTKFDIETSERDRMNSSGTELRGAMSEIELTSHDRHIYCSDLKTSVLVNPIGQSQLETKSKDCRTRLQRRQQRKRLKMDGVPERNTYELDTPKPEDSRYATNADDFISVINRDNVELGESQVLPEALFPESVPPLVVERTCKNYRRFQFWKRDDNRARVRPKIFSLARGPNKPADALEVRAGGSEGVTSLGNPADPANNFVGPPPLNTFTMEETLVLTVRLNQIEKEGSQEDKHFIQFQKIPTEVKHPVVHVRNPFIRKIYAILFTQFFAMFCVVYASMNNKRMNSFMKKYGFVGILVSLIALILLMFLGRRYPLNLILLGAYSLGITLIWANVSCYFANETVYIVIGGVALLALVQIWMASQSWWDVMHHSKSILTVAYAFYGCIVAFLMHCVSWVKIPTSYAIFGCCISLFYSWFLLYVTWTVVNEERIKITSEEHIFAAIVIYTDATAVFPFIYHLCFK